MARNNQGGDQNNPEYPPPLPVNIPRPQAPPRPETERFIYYFRFTTKDYPVHTVLDPPLTVFSASDNPWNFPFILGLLEFDFIRPSHALRPRFRIPLPNPLQPRLILPPNLRIQLFRPLHLMGEPHPPLPDFHVQPMYPVAPPPLPVWAYELPFTVHWRPPLPPVEQQQQPNNDEAP